jgi:nucleoside-diphosphate-sugar epimerase
MSNVLITGGLGFVGRRLTSELLRLGKRPVLIVRENQVDVNQTNSHYLHLGQLKEFVRTETIDCVVNLAGFYTIDDSPQSVSGLIDSNITFPTTIASQLSSEGLSPTWIQASTFMQHVESSYFDPACLYASTKEAMLMVLKHFENKGFKVVNIIFPHIYGDNDGRGKLLERLIASAKSGDYVRLSSGNQQFDLVHVSDVVNCLLQALNIRESKEFQLTSQTVLTVKEVAEKVNSSSPNGLFVTYDPKLDRPRDTIQKWIVHPRPEWWTEKFNVNRWIEEQFRDDSLERQPRRYD